MFRSIFFGLAFVFATSVTAQAADQQCGLEGNVSVVERAKQCGETRKSSTGFEWSLVSRAVIANKTFEVWRDNTTGTLWSSSVGAEPAYSGFKLCADRDHNWTARGRLSMLGWQFASAADYAAAEKHGIRDVVPGFAGRRFWTSTTRADNFRWSYTFNGSTGKFSQEAQDYVLAIRCVSYTR